MPIAWRLHTDCMQCARGRACTFHIRASARASGRPVLAGMLLGTDQVVFSSADHPAMALQLVDLQRPIRPLSILEYWLDNVMNAIPALAVCSHVDGMVKGYQVYPLPYPRHARPPCRIGARWHCHPVATHCPPPAL